MENIENKGTEVLLVTRLIDGFFFVGNNGKTYTESQLRSMGRDNYSIVDSITPLENLNNPLEQVTTESAAD